jgi:hypothetical protein
LVHSDELVLIIFIIVIGNDPATPNRVRLLALLFALAFDGTLARMLLLQAIGDPPEDCLRLLYLEMGTKAQLLEMPLVEA